VGRIPAASSASLAAPVQGSLLAEAMAALAGGTTYPIVPEMSLYNINMDIALKSIFEEGVPPEQALETAEEAILAGLGQATPTP
jgi:maltose-binding protein MalE